MSRRRNNLDDTRGDGRGDERVKAARSFLEAVIGPVLSSDRSVAIWIRDTRTRRFSDCKAAAEYAVGASATQDVYFGTCAVPASLRSGRGRFDDMMGIAALRLDIDVADQGHMTDQLPQTKESALEVLDSIGPGFPVVVDSGGGLHAYVLLDEAWIFEGDDDRQAAQLLLRRLWLTVWTEFAQRGWSLDSTWDLPRVLRVPGTRNHKIPDAPRAVQLLRLADGPRHTRQELDEVLLRLPRDEIGALQQSTARRQVQKSGRASAAPAAYSPPSVELIDEFCREIPAFADTWNLRRPDFSKADGSPDWSSYDMALAMFVAEYLYQPNGNQGLAPLIARILQAFRTKHCTDEADRAKASRSDYVQRTASKAIDSAARAHANRTRGSSASECPPASSDSAAGPTASQPPRKKLDLTALKNSPPIPPWRPFPDAALPEPLRSLVNVGSRAIGCDPSFIALPALAICAAMVGNARVAQLKRSWYEPSIMWAVTVGPSGTLKTPAFKLVIGPLRGLQDDLLRAHAQAMERYNEDKLKYEKELMAWKKSKGVGDPPNKPEEPRAIRFLVNDATMEALAVVLNENPRGVLLGMDELSGWIGSFDRYANRGSGGDAAHYLSMHVAESLLVDRKTGQQIIHVPRASLSICGGVQPGILHRALGVEHRENGLLARLLLAYPPRRAKEWTDADIPQELMATVADVYERLHNLAPQRTADGDEPLALPLTIEAKKVWVSFYNQHARDQAEIADDGLSAALSKLEAYAARFALVFHCVRQVMGDTSLASPERIDQDSMRAGVVLARWFVYETKRVYLLLGQSEEAQARRVLTEWIRRKGGTVSVRDVSHGPREYRSPGAAEEALNGLVKAGLGRWVAPAPGPSGGRPTRRFELNPESPGSETPTGDNANGGFGSGAAGAGDWNEL